MVKMVFLLFVIIGIEASAEYSRADFRIECEGTFAIIALNRAKHLSYPEIKNLAKAVCDMRADRFTRLNQWSEVNKKITCGFAVSDFIDIFSDSSTAVSDKKSVYIEACDSKR